MDAYLTAKWLHILSSTVLFGTSIGTAFHMVWAMRSDNPQVIHRTVSGALMAALLCTAPAWLIQPATGLWLIHLQGYPPTEAWLTLTYALYALAFIAWVPAIGLQFRIRSLTDSTTSVPLQARRAYRICIALGCPAFLALVAIFWLMIHRPPLWG
ncbi:DUF2269 family protein [Pseudosulfitobacter koreensis]|uniref:DUF2269 domain-containing protein n=1 Tax=Pseudosulfitobacter koreensis TaxID=2968472 RepID=A0ABT1Z373_9RHOB|nr:DUF2269 domain-containing protein [Pseudosulfitobacter koreense]MCR8827594.1 DUF2269 domain-containing protein [Pseudosulfitobacter koreense]